MDVPNINLSILICIVSNEFWVTELDLDIRIGVFNVKLIYLYLLYKNEKT